MALKHEFRDVTLFHSEDGSEWAHYLLKQYNREGLQVSIDALNLDRLHYVQENPPEAIVAVDESHVILLLLTTGLITYMENEAAHFSKLLNERDEDVTSVVVARLEVDEEDLEHVCKVKNYFDNNWNIMKVDVDGKNINDIVTRTLMVVDWNRDIFARRLKRRQSSHREAYAVTLVPSCVRGPGELVMLVFKEELKNEVTVRFSSADKDTPTQVVNPYCVSFESPAFISEEEMRLKITMGEKVLKLKLYQRVPHFSSVELLFQAMGLGTEGQLDKRLAELATDSLCSDSQGNKWLDELLTSSGADAGVHRSSLYPTLLHWAAAHGLSELCSVLLSSPGAQRACAVLNVDLSDPAELASLNNHRELSEYISNLMETQYVAAICDQYIQWLPASVDDTNTETQDSVYETMNPPTSEIYSDISMSMLPPPLPQRRFHSSSSSEQMQSAKEFLQKPHAHPLQAGAIGMRSQQELIDIMEEVKQGNFTCSQAEMLFRSWQERNTKSHVPVSFREKQKLLDEFRNQHRVGVQLLAKASKTGQQGTERKDKKKNKKMKDGKNIDDKQILTISEPFQSRKLFTSGTASDRESNISNLSVDSGRSSTLSRSSLSSCDADNQTQNRNSSAATYTRLIESDRAQESLQPPPVPKRKPVLYTRKEQGGGQ